MDDKKGLEPNVGTATSAEETFRPLESRYLKEKIEYFSEEQRNRTSRESEKMAKRTRENLRAQRNRAKGMEYFDEIVAYGGVRVIVRLVAEASCSEPTMRFDVVDTGTFAESGSRVACICSSDTIYAEQAASTAAE